MGSYDREDVPVLSRHPLRSRSETSCPTPAVAPSPPVRDPTQRPSLDARAVLGLQRSIGNAAVAQLLRPRMVQRCGGTVHPGCSCAETAGEEGAVAKGKGEPVGDEQIKTKVDSPASGEAASGTVSSAPAVERISGVPVVFETVYGASEDLAQDSAKMRVCSAAGAAVPTTFPLARSTGAQRGAMGACTWGITSPDNLKVRTTTCEDGAGNWTLRVLSVLSRVRTFSRLLAGQREPTVASSRRTTFCTQVHELDVLGVCPGAWYMLAAVKAHERVHVDEWKSSFPTDWPAVQTIIEGLTVPKSGATAGRAAATAALRSSVAFTNALRTGNGVGFPTFWAIPDPNANTDAAERAIVDPRITAICNKAQTKGWSPGICAECIARGII